MPQALMLRIDPTASEASWQYVENGQLAGPHREGRLADARRAAQGVQVIVLIPAEEIFLVQMPLPGKNRKKLLKAVPYAVEDQLVEETDNLHFALSSHADNGKYVVAAVEHRMIEYWDKTIKAAGIRADMLIPDASALVDGSADWTVLMEARRALVRTPLGVFATDINMLPVMLNNVWQQAGENRPAHVTVYDCSRAAHMTTLRALTSDIEYEVIDCAQGVFGILAAHFDPRRCVNLLQGEYEREKNISKHLKVWIPTAILFAVWLGSQMVLSVFEYLDLSSRNQLLSKQMQDVYKSAFPGEKAPAPGYERSAMESRLKDLLKRQGKSAGSVQEMMVKVAPILKNTQGITINGMRYLNGALEIEMVIAQSSEIDPLKTRLATQTGWDVSQQASTDKGVTKVRFKIKSTS